MSHTRRDFNNKTKCINNLRDNSQLSTEQNDYDPSFGIWSPNFPITKPLPSEINMTLITEYWDSITPTPKIRNLANVVKRKGFLVHSDQHLIYNVVVMLQILDVRADSQDSCTGFDKFEERCCWHEKNRDSMIKTVEVTHTTIWMKKMLCIKQITKDSARTIGSCDGQCLSLSLSHQDEDLLE